jgi:hypothetical protein
VEGAELAKTGANEAKLRLRLPASNTETYPREKIVLHFAGKR